MIYFMHICKPKYTINHIAVSVTDLSGHKLHWNLKGDHRFYGNCLILKENTARWSRTDGEKRKHMSRIYNSTWTRTWVLWQKLLYLVTFTDNLPSFHRGVNAVGHVEQEDPRSSRRTSHIYTFFQLQTETEGKSEIPFITLTGCNSHVHFCSKCVKQIRYWLEFCLDGS